MKQKQFEVQNEPLWQEITLVLEKKSTHSQDFPSLYRRLCQNLALSLQRGYSPALTDYLQKLVTQSHQQLYGASAARPLTLRYWLGQELPRTVRQEWRLLLLASLAFFGVALLVGVLVVMYPDMAYSFAPASQLDQMTEMYQSGVNKFGREKAESDVMMFGFYIWNNVSIDFRCFAAGLFGGVPALLLTGFNGLHGGVVAGWLHLNPATRMNFWSFVVTHASFEITGLLLAATAGMRLGLSLIMPGRLSRRHALSAASIRMFPVIVGGALLTALAAFFEAFWSASSVIPMTAKFAVGGCCWGLVIVFFVFAGRQQGKMPRA